jgi:hypothetical protein
MVSKDAKQKMFPSKKSTTDPSAYPTTEDPIEDDFTDTDTDTDEIEDGEQGEVLVPDSPPYDPKFWELIDEPNPCG